jgi:hypothetical protein
MNFFSGLGGWLSESPADPHRSEEFSPWHLADRVASPVADIDTPQDAFAIRYRVL